MAIEQVLIHKSDCILIRLLTISLHDFQKTSTWIWHSLWAQTYFRSSLLSTRKLTMAKYVWHGTPQASQAQVTSVLCKLTFSQESRCRVTSNRWDFVWEIKYWGLRTLNIIILTYFSIKYINLALSNKNSQTNPTKSMNSHQTTKEYIKGKSPLFIL